MYADSAMTSAIAPSISCLIVRYCACRSTKGIFMSKPTSDSSRAAATDDEEACWIARINSGNGNVLGNNCAGSDDYLVADRHRKDCGICSNADVIPNFGRSPELRLLSCRPGGEKLINKYRAVRHEQLVPDRYGHTNERV